MSGSSFIQMAGIIKFVTMFPFFLPAFFAEPGMNILRVDGSCGIEIAVRFLCVADDLNQRVDVQLKLFVGNQAQ